MNKTTRSPSGSEHIGFGQLTADLRALGLKRGQDLLIHCSLRKIGWIAGGTATLLNAIIEVAGPEATLVVATHTTLNSLTSAKFLEATAGLTAQGRTRYVAAMPGFDPATTPSTGMGVFAEYLRTRPLASRSHHPQVSFAAIGPGASACMSTHDLDCHLGERSPLGWLYKTDADILLLGVDYSACTAFHLAEYRLPNEPPRRLYHCFTANGETRVQHGFNDIDLDDSDFKLLGTGLESVAGQDPASGLRRGQVGSADCRLISMRLAVDFACYWLALHRKRALR